MSFIYIIVGVLVGGWAASARNLPESQQPQIFYGPIGSLIQFVCQFGGLGLVIYGLVKLFT